MKIRLLITMAHSVTLLSSSQGFLSVYTIPSPKAVRCLKRKPQCQTAVLHQSKGDGENDKRKSRYVFGSITKSLVKRATEKVNDLTGKDTYEFGDLSRWLDSRAKERVQAIKGEKGGGGGGDYQYELGDFTRWADALAKQKAAQFSGKQHAQDYEFGDISKAVISKVRSGEYNLDDVLLALRILLTAGFSLLPVASLLPIRGLIQLVNLGLAQEIGGRMMGVLATTLDARMKEAVTGKSDYQLGDLTKDRLLQSLAAFTGKDTYEFGDITRAVMDRSTNAPAVEGKPELVIQDQVVDDLALWDLKFLEQEPSGSVEMIAAAELEKWDNKLREQEEKKGAQSKSNPE